MDITGMTREELFQEFWLAYPRRVSKGQARKAFAAIPLLEFGAIMDGLERAKQCAQWHKDGGMFIPYPATWLRAEGWLDEYDITLPKLQPQRSAVIDRCDVQGCEAYATITMGRKQRCSAHVFSSEEVQA